MRKGRILSTLALVLSLLMMISIFAACGNQASDSSNNQSSNQAQATTGDQTVKSVEIQWWTPNWDEKESNEMAAEFMEANPGQQLFLKTGLPFT